MHGILERFCYSKMGTFGQLTFPGTDGPSLYTVELPWRGNRANESCIPEGEYFCEAHDTDQFPETWAVVAEDGSITHWQDPAAQRFAILFHVGNTMRAVDGCIAVGQDLACSDGLWAVYPSQPAMDALRDHLSGVDRWQLSILPYRMEYP